MQFLKHVIIYSLIIMSHDHACNSACHRLAMLAQPQHKKKKSLRFFDRPKMTGKSVSFFFFFFKNSSFVFTNKKVKIKCPNIKKLSQKGTKLTKYIDIKPLPTLE